MELFLRSGLVQISLFFKSGQVQISLFFNFGLVQISLFLKSGLVKIFLFFKSGLVQISLFLKYGLVQIWILDLTFSRGCAWYWDSYPRGGMRCYCLRGLWAHSIIVAIVVNTSDPKLEINSNFSPVILYSKVSSEIWVPYFYKELFKELYPAQIRIHILQFPGPWRL